MNFWFQKKTSEISGASVTTEQAMRYNALMGANPQAVISAISSYNAGYLAPLARIIEEYELRDDKMTTCAKKMKAAVARCDFSVLKREGCENDPRAEEHAQILRRFWSGVRCTSRFKQDETGGIGLLQKQMMDAESYGYSVHEIVWKILPNGEITAQFIKMPLWHFENKTGKLRFLKSSSDTDGETMREGEWLVGTGDAVGVAAAICACLKRCTLADWAVFCERCGMPFFLGQTTATYGSKQWNDLVAALKAIGRDARMLTDKTTEIKAVQTSAGNQPYSPLIDWADRAIAALYRGADLSTISNQLGMGATLQGDEMGLLEQDACRRMTETLHEQVERFVIRFVCGDAEPLASIKIVPAKKPDVDQEIKIDRHLISAGCKLSRLDALQRYGRVEVADASDEDTPLEKGEIWPTDGQTGQTGVKTAENAVKTPRKEKDGQ